jgi:hypothetical protein
MDTSGRGFASTPPTAGGQGPGSYTAAAGRAKRVTQNLRFAGRLAMHEPCIICRTLAEPMTNHTPHSSQKIDSLGRGKRFPEQHRPLSVDVDLALDPIDESLDVKAPRPLLPVAGRVCAVHRHPIDLG